jgi:hypothetical protein
MVNDRFRRVPIYGFEMVDGRAGARFRTTMVINRKFTPNRMSHLFGEFPAILPQYNTCDLSRAVSQEQSGQASTATQR